MMIMTLGEESDVDLLYGVERQLGQWRTAVMVAEKVLLKHGIQDYVSGAELAACVYPTRDIPITMWRLWRYELCIRLLVLRWSGKQLEAVSHFHKSTIAKARADLRSTAGLGL